MNRQQVGLVSLMQHLGQAARRMALAYFLWSLGEGLWLYIQPVYLGALGADCRRKPGWGWRCSGWGAWGPP
ncbi:MAG: hypothetical protein HC915_20065, partial [Anaerolineae bacterium]|nr:hypothetical protein [Anaerolineae bacterium]